MKKFTLALLSAFLVFLFTFSAFSTSAAVIDDENKYKYDEIVIPYVLEKYSIEDEELSINYMEVYEYFSNPATTDEIVPEYVLIYLSSNIGLPSNFADVFGNYVLRTNSGSYPYTYNYAVYIPETEEIYSLSKAFEVGLNGIEYVFTEVGIGELIGDMDKDRKITIKDATHIQKCLAGLLDFDKQDYIDAFGYEENPSLLYISDFNRDCKRNIKDATAIQKHLAKIDY